MIGPRILLVVGGGIAAYKACELVRLIRKGGGSVTCVLTEGGSHFVTAMTLAALSENPVHTTLWDLRNEAEMGHIRLSREADLVVVCPATADLLARMACGIADDLATTLMLATDKPVMAVPAMNVRMWLHPATRRNVQVLREAGCMVLDPDDGAMACGEYGPGRLPDPEAIWAQIEALFTGPDALPIQAPVEPPKQGGIAPGSLYEALEPEDEGDYEAEGAPSLSLSASMIARSGTGRAPSLDDDPPEGWVPQSPFADIAEPADLSAGGPIMAQKGAAKAAPPTDPQALNHMVSARQSAPEPLAGDAHPVAVEPELPADGPLSGKHILVTAGPTHEPIDPVRYIANRSSGKQGYAIAEAAARLGARVTLVSGPVNLPTPRGVDRIDVETAQQMADAVKHALPADCAVMVAAVADWRTKDVSAGKMKKRGSAPPVLMLTENPDILASVAAGTRKPALLVGFAAETDDVLKYASEKRLRKGADWIVANDVSQDVMGAETNQVHIVTKDGVESLPLMAKGDVAMAIVERIADALVPAED